LKALKTEYIERPLHDDLDFIANRRLSADLSGAHQRQGDVA